MIRLPQRDTKTLVAIHGWSGVLLGLLLYAVIVTGMAAVFAPEIDDWASPLAATTRVPFAGGIDATVRRLAREVDPQFHEDIAIYAGPGGRLNFLFHRHQTGPDGKPSERGVEFELDPVSGATLAQRSGWVEEIEEQRRAGGISAFLVDLHVRLHLPEPWGLLLTGVLGLAMMLAAVTGILIHRHLLRDLFTLRLRRGMVLERRDLHVVAGTWNLPFALVLAFTGSFFSFATTIGLPAIAFVSFDGDQAAMIETLYGSARAEDAGPATLSNLDAMIADARRRAAAEPDFVVVEHFGRADATATIYTDYAAGELVYSSQLYDAAGGSWLREQPPLGKTPSLGATLMGLMYPLHFGNFAGAASKAVWVALGFSGAYVTLTGLLLWTRRRVASPGWRRLERAVHYVGYGLPLSLAVAPYAYFALRDGPTPTGTTQGIAFLGMAALALVVTVATKDCTRLRRRLLGAIGVALLGLPLLRYATGGPGWLDASAAGHSAVPAVDLALFVIGMACLWSARRSRATAATVLGESAVSGPEARTA